jgi:hypothetical protein
VGDRPRGDRRLRLRLRTLFAFILHFCTVGDPRKLWDDFKDPLCDNLPHAIARFGSDRPDLTFPDAHHDYGLFLLARELQEHGRSLSDFQLPPYHALWAQVHPHIYIQVFPFTSR